MLAIIVPYYKLAFFDTTLNSFVNQTDKRFKVYIGDDASPESPIDLLESYKGAFDFEYQRFEDNYGSLSLVKQWERCISMTKDEEWLMIFGDDDVMQPNCIATFYEKLEEIKKLDIKVVRFATQVINGEGIFISNVFFHPKLEKASDSFFRKFEKKNRSSLSEYVFLKESYLKFGFCDYPLAWHSDDKAWLDFTNQSPIFSINEYFVSIRISNQNISGIRTNANEKQQASFQFYRDLIFQNLNQFKISQRQLIFLKYEEHLKLLRVPNIKDWFFLFKKHLIHFHLLYFLKFQRRFILSLFQ